MTRNKAIVILVIIAAIFSVFAFAVPFPKGTVFWTAYIAELIALALQIPIFKMAFDRADSPESKFLGFPVFRVGYIYLGVQTALSLALFTLGFTPMPAWIAVVLCAIVLGAALACSLATNIARGNAERIEQAQTSNTELMMTLRTRSSQLTNKTNDRALRSALEKLAENIKFSDPVSSHAIAENDRQLETAFAALEKTVISNVGNAAELCRQAQTALDDRNRACKINKG